MDDSMESVPSMKAAVELYSQLSQLWRSTGMYARKWLSNEPEVYSICGLCHRSGS